MNIIFVSPMLRTINIKNAYQIQLLNLAKGLKKYKTINSFFVIPSEDIPEFVQRSDIDLANIIGLIPKIPKKNLMDIPIKGIQYLHTYYSYFEDIIKKINPDIIVSMEDYTLLTYILCKLKLKYNYKFIVYHGPYYYPERINILHKIYNLYTKIQFHNCVDIFVAKTQASKDFLFNIYGNRIPIVKIPPPIDTDFFVEKEVKKDHETILYVGRINLFKGWDILLRIILELASKEDMLLKIITVPNEFSNSIKRIVLSNDLLKKKVRIYYNKPLQSIVNEYNTSYITINTSYYEIFGMVIAESLSCGTPVISTPTGGAKEIIINYYNGILTKSFKPKHICDSIILLKNNEYLYKRLRNNARKSIVSRFSIPIISLKWKKLFESIYENNNKP